MSTVSCAIKTDVPSRVDKNLTNLLLLLFVGTVPPDSHATASPGGTVFFNRPSATTLADRDSV